jgi:hypothetical protein
LRTVDGNRQRVCTKTTGSEAVSPIVSKDGVPEASQSKKGPGALPPVLSFLLSGFILSGLAR